MILHGVFPEGEKLLRAWLTAWFVEHGQPWQVWSVLEEGWEDRDQQPLPLVLVERVPGSGPGARDEPYDGMSHLDVSVYARTRAEVWPLVQAIEVAMLALPNSTSPAIDTVGTSQSFGIIPYANPRIERALATYELTARAQ